jgi:hypothetical protein
LGTYNVTLPNAASTLPIYTQQITYAGPTVARTITYPDANITVARTDAANTFTGIQTFSTPIATASVATMTATVGGGVPTPPNNTTTFLRGDGTFAAPSTSTVQIQPISASVAANALTISASALSLDFRSATLTSGAVTTVSGTPANLVISSGSTLGTTNAQQSRVVVLAINNAGTIELAAVNLLGGVALDETGLISTTAEGGAGAADSATVVYSTTARSNVAYRVIGYVESTQATAGTWATAPSTIQGAGGNALTAMGSLGYGQAWSVQTRASGTTYYNTTGKPIGLNVEVSNTAANCSVTVAVNGGTAYTIAQATSSGGGNTSAAGFHVIPANARYVLTVTGTHTTRELR